MKPRQVFEAGRARVAQAAVSDGRRSAGFGGGGAGGCLEENRFRENSGRLMGQFLASVNLLWQVNGGVVQVYGLLVRHGILGKDGVLVRGVLGFVVGTVFSFSRRKRDANVVLLPRQYFFV